MDSLPADVPLARRFEIVEVTAFIDWNSQLLLTGSDSSRDPKLAARMCLERTAGDISRILSKTAPEKRFRVRLRLYHGWHKGFEPTANFRAVRTAIAEADFSALSLKPNVTFSDQVGFGNDLLDALPKRRHPSVSVHLPNTLRSHGRGKKDEEKMVDTAMATDLLCSAQNFPNEWIVAV